MLSSAKRQKSGSSLGSSTAATSSLQRTLSSPSRRPPAAWSLIVEVHLDCRGASAVVALPRLPPRPECCHLPESSDHMSIFLERANPPPSRRTIEECAGYRSYRLYRVVEYLVDADVAVVVGMVIPTFCRGLTDHLALSCAKYVSPLGRTPTRPRLSEPHPDRIEG